jgi:hypothetical protein
LADGSEIGVSTMIYEIYKSTGIWNLLIGGLRLGSTARGDDASRTPTRLPSQSRQDNIIRGFAGTDVIYGGGGTTRSMAATA